MKVGDSVKVVGMPKGLPIETKPIFERCVGRIFSICGIVQAPGLDSELLELQVGEVVGHADYMHSIWIEKEFVTTADPLMKG